VEQAYRLQLARQGKSNARLSSGEVETWCQPDAAAASLLAQAINRLDLSARAYHRILKMARTIADLGGVERIGAAHVAEAVQYRRVMTG
jgi:magnesium chelatase family protein